MNHKVLITTSGIGQRLGELTKYTNKALVRVGKKPAISYIIEGYPIDTEFVVTVGYYGDHVREFLSLAYPDRKIEFVEVDKYQGEGSSLGYSMLQARSYLQCPFIYHATDTIVTEDIPVPEQNWIGVYKGDNTTQYASWQTKGGGLVFNDKGAIDFDYIHIGLIGIKDHQKFWDTLEELYKQVPNDSSLNDCAVLVDMLQKGESFKTKEFSVWYDIGNITALEEARNNIADSFHNLDKLKEAVFLFDDFVIKFFNDKKGVEERVSRAEKLKFLTPAIQGVTLHFYRYEYVEGDIYSDVATADNFGDLLDWAENNLWHPESEMSDDDFKTNCRNFYYDKTKSRIEQLLVANNMHDEVHIINGLSVPKVFDILAQVDFDWLSDTKQSRYHGDFILENIVKTENGFSLIDWRNNFGSSVHSGDIYYDLAKLNHNLTVNHDIVNRDLFTVDVAEDGTVSCDILRKNNLVECQRVLFEFLDEKGYDARKIRVLTGLIWLNMSPLHHHPFNLFLYYFGKLHLWQAINQK